MPICPHCHTVAPEGALFCARCGHTVVPATSGPFGAFGASSAGVPPILTGPPPSPTGNPPPPPPPPPPPEAAPPEWIPPQLVGQAIHCPRCNTLISPVAVVCPVCQAPVRTSSAGVEAVGPPG